MYQVYHTEPNFTLLACFLLRYKARCVMITIMAKVFHINIEAQQMFKVKLKEKVDLILLNYPRVKFVLTLYSVKWCCPIETIIPSRKYVGYLHQTKPREFTIISDN